MSNFRSRWISSTAIIPVLLLAPAHAQDEEASQQVQDVVIVTGTARATSALSTPADVDAAILSGEEKLRQQATSLGDTLDFFAGVDTLGTGDQVGKPVIRGLSGNRIRVLSDGIGLDFQQYGVRHPPNVDPYLAERIEIVRGASSILYGSDAIGGAVNVISRRPPSAAQGETVFGGEITAAYQSAYRQGTGAITMEAANGPLGITGTFVYRDSDGLVTPDEPTALETGNPRDPLVTGDIPFSDFEQTNGDIAIGYETPRGPVVLRYEGYRNEHNFVVPNPPPPNGNPLQAGGIGQNLENDIVHLFGDFRLNDTWTLKPSVAYSSNLRVSNAGPPEPMPREFLPDAAVLDIERNNLTGRLEADHEEIMGLAGRVGIEAESVKQDSRGSVALTPGGTVDKLAVFGLEELRLGKLIFNIGARFDHIETEGAPSRTKDTSGLPADPELLKNDYSVFTGSFGAVYQFTDSLSVTASVGRGFRSPDLFELYANGQHGGVSAIQRGDPSLGEETSLSYDASIRYSSDQASFKLTGYYNDISDYIFLAGTGQNAPGSGLPIFQISQQDAELAGFDFQGDYALNENLRLRGTLEYVDGELSDGQQVPLLPPLKASVGLEYSWLRFGTIQSPYVSVGVEYADNQQSAGLIEPFGQFDSPPPPFGTASTENYTLVNAGVGGQIGQLDLSVSIDNLLDEPYRDFLDTYKNITLGAGRNVSLKASYAF